MELKSNLLGHEGKDMDFEHIKDPIYLDLDVKGVAQEFDAGPFKQFCATKGYHLVDFKANSNSLNTANNGTGRLKIRLGDESDFKEVQGKLRQMGMEVDNHTEKHELKGHYIGVAGLNWTDSNLAVQERRLHGKDFVDAKEQKMKELESNGDVFGNSEGVGKWDSEWKAQNKGKKGPDTYTPEDNVQTLNWKKSIKNLEKIKNPMYKSGTNFQSQKLYSSTSSKILTNNK